VAEAPREFDLPWLRSWIASSHLEPDAIETYRQSFDAHPARLLVLHDFLVSQAGERISDFLNDEVEVEPTYGLYSSDGECPREQWLRAEAADRFYKLGLFSGVRPEHRLSSNALTFLRLREVLADHRFLAFFERIVGRRLGRFRYYAHFMTYGDFLLSHTDEIRNRQLAHVLFLSPHWESRFGGALHVVAHGGEMSVVQPEFNQLVLLDVTAKSEHFVSPIEPEAAGSKRVTLGGWIERAVEAGS
jgi:Rps23 Pro-64 3,4-dihydroxylase Tpa1-like proline 4-hydroxylase